MTAITIIGGALALFLLILIILIPVFIHGIYNNTTEMKNALKDLRDASDYQSQVLWEILNKKP